MVVCWAVPEAMVFFLENWPEMVLDIFWEKVSDWAGWAATGASSAKASSFLGGMLTVFPLANCTVVFPLLPLLTIAFAGIVMPLESCCVVPL